MSKVEIHTDKRVRVVTITRPEVRNAVDRETADLLHHAFVEFDADANVDVAILAGGGGAFCAGADLKALSDGQGNRLVADMAVPGPPLPATLHAQ
jgi:enoyl-CoA hydratase